MFFKSSHGDIYYEIHGQNDSLMVAFFHGLSTDHKMFENQVAVLKDQYRLLLWDMPEHGKSFELKKEFSFAIAAKSFVELLDELGIESVALVGTSLGGYVSQFIAANYPERVKALLVSGAHPLHVRFNWLAVMAFRVHSIITRILPLKVIKYGIEKMLVGDDKVKPYMEESILQLDKEKLLRLSEGTKRGVIEGVDKPFKHPVMIVNGENELSFIRKIAVDRHKNNGGFEYVEIPGAGHAAILEKPKEFNEILHNFLNKLQP